MKDVQNLKEKQPTEKDKKKTLTRIFTFVGGGLGIVILIAFGIIFLQPTARVNFYGKGIFLDSVVINNEGKIEVPKDPERQGYNFLGWYDNKDFSGDPIDWEDYEFLAEAKRFGFFGKVENLPVQTNLYAKWELHKYQIEVIDFSTGNPIVIYDEDGNVVEDVEFYITVQIKDEDDIEKFVKDYMDNVITAASTDAEKKAAESAGKTIAMAPKLEIKQIWNFHYFNGMEDIQFVDKNGDLLEPIDRSKLEITYDEDGNEEPVLTVYVKNYNNQ